MTLKGTVTQEFLDSVDDPDGIEAVFKRFSGSKGPLYQGLAAATATLRGRLGKLQQQTAVAEARQSSLEQKVESQAGQIEVIEKRIQERRPMVEQADAMLKGVQGLLDQADWLSKAGLGEQELARLHQLLAQITANQGLQPKEGVAQFFETVSSYEQIVSLDLEAKRAEVEAESAKSEARVSTIDLVKKLLSQGVRAQDLPHWQGVLNKAGVTAKELSG